jgi:hypothetical protein
MKFRDKKTGRFVSKSTWARSKAHGGTRYVRERTVSEKKKKLPEPEEFTQEEIDRAIEEEFEEDEEAEYEGAFDSP